MGFATRVTTWSADESVAASDLNAEFNIAINALSDGTKDANMAAATFTALTSTGALTVSGAAAITGNVSANNASFTGNLAVTGTTTLTGNVVSHILPTNATYTLGSATKNFVSLALDNGATDGGAVYFDAGTTKYIKENAAGTAMTVVTGGALTLGDSAIAKTSAPVANSLYVNSICKAWALLTVGAAGAVTVTEGFNVNTASWSTSTLTINFHTNLASANYAVNVTGEAAAGVANQTVDAFVKTSGRAVGSVQLLGRKRDGSDSDFIDGMVLHVMVFGT